jgi:hypothetical protein
MNDAETGSSVLRASNGWKGEDSAGRCLGINRIE